MNSRMPKLAVYKKYIKSTLKQINMKTFYFELFGLIGFFISGLIFIVAGLRIEDYLGVSGSIVWTVACVLWLVPVLSRGNS